jgi:hypothetical protein
VPALAGKVLSCSGTIQVINHPTWKAPGIVPSSNLPLSQHKSRSPSAAYFCCVSYLGLQGLPCLANHVRVSNTRIPRLGCEMRALSTSDMTPTSSRFSGFRLRHDADWRSSGTNSPHRARHKVSIYLSDDTLTMISHIRCGSVSINPATKSMPFPVRTSSRQLLRIGAGSRGLVGWCLFFARPETRLPKLPPLAPVPSSNAAGFLSIGHCNA